jgi:hypothetical protein
LFEGTFGFSSAGQGKIKGELVVSGSERKLSFTTQADNKVTATQNANGIFVGTMTNQRGRPIPITITKVEQLAAQEAAAAAVLANRVLLTKAELEAIVVGRKWKFYRHSTGQTLAWDFRKEGVMFGVNQSLGTSGPAQWSVNDEAQLCLKFTGQGGNPCYMVARDGASLKLLDASSPSVVNADLTVE